MIFIHLQGCKGNAWMSKSAVPNGLSAAKIFCCSIGIWTAQGCCSNRTDSSGSYIGWAVLFFKKTQSNNSQKWGKEKWMGKVFYFNSTFKSGSLVYTGQWYIFVSTWNKRKLHFLQSFMHAVSMQDMLIFKDYLYRVCTVSLDNCAKNR